MTPLSKINELAREAGVTYGKYTAMTEPPRNPKTPTEPLSNNATCEHCGAPYYRARKNGLYCSEECRYEKILGRQRIYKRRKPT